MQIMCLAMCRYIYVYILKFVNLTLNILKQQYLYFILSILIPTVHFTLAINMLILNVWLNRKYMGQWPYDFKFRNRKSQIH